MIESRLELLDTRPAVQVAEAEYRRLLGYPRGHVPDERPRELEAVARRWYAEHGRPWVYLREAELVVGDDSLRFDGVEFRSRQLHHHLKQAGAERAMLAVVSAGRECEEHARQLWQEAKPDEYFFLEILGSAVVEHLVASLNGRICDLAERDGLVAIRHYSPGYTGWDIADQNRLFEVIAGGVTQAFPEPMEVLSSGMLKPKKSLLAVVGLTARTNLAPGAAPLVPCNDCSYAPCNYRRAPYQHAAMAVNGAAKPASHASGRGASYTVSHRALQKWAEDRVDIVRGADGSIEASFRFDGTTCANMGQPLAFDYAVSLAPCGNGYALVSADCRPAAGDEGYKSTCAYLSDAEALMKAIGAERPPLGRSLDEIFGWTENMAASGCHCTSGNRAHKWSLALQAIHYALTRTGAAGPKTPDSR